MRGRGSKSGFGTPKENRRRERFRGDTLKNYKKPVPAGQVKRPEVVLMGPKIPKNKSVCGKNAVRETLNYKSDLIESLYFVREDEELCRKAGEILREKMFKIKFDDLTEALGTDSHQGFCAVLKEENDVPLESLSFIKDEDAPAFIVALDGVEDPHNVGAIFRASECFGVNAVMWAKGRGAELTPAAAKVSVGASVLVPAIRPVNLVAALQALKKKGFWIAGAAMGEGAESVNSFDWPKRTVLVLGAEGFGVSRLALENCDFKVMIPMYGSIDSLNVSQAGAVFMAAWKAKTIS
jgi:23S rRNA (guanosine2251-2'-O)-methyltransferase